MAKRNLSAVTADLASLAEGVPSQKHRAQSAREPTEAVSQFSMSLRRSLRKELAAAAAAADMTMRAYVLSALRDSGLSVTDADLSAPRRIIVRRQTKRE